MDDSLSVFSKVLQEIKFLQATAEIHLNLTKKESMKLTQEYAKFLVLKIISKDYQHLKLAATSEINKLWHLHLLYPKHYYLFCKNQTSGQIINHSPDAKFDGKYKQRLQNTLELYSTIFGSPPKNIWSS